MQGEGCILIRVDVDHVFGNHILDYFNFLTGIRLSKNQFEKVYAILDSLKKYDVNTTFFFRPFYTLPSRHLVWRIKKQGCDIGLHADKTLNIGEMIIEKRFLEKQVGFQINGVTVHGEGILAKGEGRWRGFLKKAVEVGYRYDATSGPENPTWKPRKFRFNEGEIILFGKHLTLDTLVRIYQNRALSYMCKICRKIVLNGGIFILLIHPRLYLKYGFYRPTREIFEKFISFCIGEGFSFSSFKEITDTFLRV